MKLVLRWVHGERQKKTVPIRWTKDSDESELLIEKELTVYECETERNDPLRQEIEVLLQSGQQSGPVEVVEMCGMHHRPEYVGRVQWELVGETKAEREWLAYEGNPDESEPDPLSVHGQYGHPGDPYIPGRLQGYAPLDATQMKRLLLRAKPYTIYGPGYNRNIAVAVEDLRTAIKKSAPTNEWIRILELRLDAKEKEGNPMSKKQNPRKGAEAFFYEHAGYGYDPKKETKEQGRRRGAKALAKAEQWAWDNGYTFVWEEDPDGWDSLGDVDPADVTGVYIVAMRDSKGNVVQSLGGILTGHNSVANQHDGRVFEAELALEEMPTKGGKKKKKNPGASKRKQNASHGDDDYHRRNVILDPELVERASHWHGGQNSMVYSLVSTGMNDYVSPSMIDAAVSELEHDLSANKKRPKTHRWNRKEVAELKDVIGELDAVARNSREYTTEEHGLGDVDSGYADWLMDDEENPSRKESVRAIKNRVMQ